MMSGELEYGRGVHGCMYQLLTAKPVRKHLEKAIRATFAHYIENRSRLLPNALLDKAGNESDLTGIDDQNALPDWVHREYEVYGKVLVRDGFRVGLQPIAKKVNEAFTYVPVDVAILLEAMVDGLCVSPKSPLLNDADAVSALLQRAIDRSTMLVIDDMPAEGMPNYRESRSGFKTA